MNKPKFFYYPIVDADEVSKYLSEFYGEKIDVIDILFGWDVSNDTYVDYSIEEPREEYHGGEWESLEHWELRKKVETYLVNEFPDWKYVLFKVTHANLHKTAEGRLCLFCKSIWERYALKGCSSVDIRYELEEEDEKLIDLDLIVKLLEQEKIKASNLTIEDDCLHCRLSWFNSTEKNLIYKRGKYDF